MREQHQALLNRDGAPALLTQNPEVVLGAGFAGVRLILRINPGDIPRINENGSGITLDHNILLFTLGISILTGTVFGLAPAIIASRANLAAALNENGARALAFAGVSFVPRL